MDLSEQSSSQSSYQRYVRFWLRDRLILLCMAIFGAVWTYTEVTERVEYAQFKTEFVDFYSAGGRFTSEDGKELENKLDASLVMLNAHLIHSAQYSQIIDDMTGDIKELKARIAELEDALNNNLHGESSWNYPHQI